MEDVGERSLRRSPVQSYLILSLGDPGKAFRKNVQKIYRFYLGRWNSFSSIFRQAWLPRGFWPQKLPDSDAILRHHMADPERIVQVAFKVERILKSSEDSTEETPLPHPLRI